jgi:osmotically-inducible protein OsmY
VVDPDSSFRPSKAQEDEADGAHRAARERAQMTDQEIMLYAKLSEELLDDHALGDIGFELDHHCVTLHGSVRDARAITYLEDLARSVPGVEVVINHLVVRG